ncbi:MAG: hypothetical protein RLZZ535_2032, partial [Cyanobacteriota bacterium]
MINNYQAKISRDRLFRFLAYFISVAILVIWLSLTVHHPVVAQNELQDELEVVAEFPAAHPPGNIAITPEGRI